MTPSLISDSLALDIDIFLNLYFVNCAHPFNTQYPQVGRRPSQADAVFGDVVASDFRGPRDWRRPLLELAGRHDVVAVEIRDPREEELPNAGALWLVDPETGRELRVDTRSERLRARYAAAAAAERSEVAHDFASVGVRHVVLSTSGDWLRSLAVFLRRRRR